ncbi:hypothetical protein KEM52_005591 [Ascosphaera acerosa]|nr:hypothetical protein KEM52_005591 [Ascosphaera acerosa]
MAPRVSIPPVTRATILLVVGLTVIYGLARFNRYEHLPADQTAASTTAIEYLVLIPASVLYNPWTLITATFVEHNLSAVLITAPTVFYGGKYLERAWGSGEFVKFLAVVAVATNSVLAVAYLLWSAVLRSNASQQVLCGGLPLLSAFLVAFKQLVPEHTVTVLRGLISMRVKHFPALFLALNLLGSLLVFRTAACFNLSALGLLVSWTYLRFIKRQPGLSGTATSARAAIRGDAGDTFAFACFFPDRLQPVISAVADRVYEALVRVRVIRPWTEEMVMLSNEQAVARGQAGLPSLLSASAGRGRRREEAERRRALALRALDQRLQAASAAHRAPPAHPAGPSSAPGPSQSAAPAPQQQHSSSAKAESKSASQAPQEGAAATN